MIAVRPTMRRLEFRAAPIASTIGSLASISRFTEFVESGLETEGVRSDVYHRGVERSQSGRLLRDGA